jgi:tetratricopeptide (TPR) repeat protein
MTVADRWFYFPIVGLLGTLGVTLKAISHQKKKIESFVVTSLIIILVLLSLRTMVRNTDWKDNISLHSHDRLIYTNPNIEYDLASEYAFLEEYDKSIFHLRKSIEMFPCEDNLFSLGYMYELKGDVNMAKKYYIDAFHAKKCKQIPHTHIISTYTRLGRILLIYDSPENAKKYIKAGILDYPKSDVLWAMLAVSEYKLQHYNEAMEAAQKAKDLSQNYFTQYVFEQILNKKPVELQLFFKK